MMFSSMTRIVTKLSSIDTAAQIIEQRTSVSIQAIP